MIVWRLDSGDERTYAAQIASQVRRGIAEGEIGPGARLPSGRELAAMLEINLHTVLRAYQELRDEGLLDLRRGRGAVVTLQAGSSRGAVLARASELVAEARRTGAGLAEALDAVARAWHQEPAFAVGPRDSAAPAPTPREDLS